MRFSIEHNTIKALLLIAAKNDVRYYLNGILLDVRETDATAVVTDGHKMMAVPLTLDYDSPRVVGQYIVPRELLDGVKPSHKSLPIGIIINPEARSPDLYRDGVTIKTPPSVTIDNGTAKMNGQLVNATYPDWRRVVPASVSGIASQFDHEYVAAFGKAHVLMGGKHSPTIMHNGGERESAARVILAGDAIGVLMPMRTDIPATLDNPSWLSRDSAPMAVAA